MSGAIEVSTEVTIDHRQLGVEFAQNWNNHEQRDFLLGMLEGFTELGPISGGIQIRTIWESATIVGRETELKDLIDWLRVRPIPKKKNL